MGLYYSFRVEKSTMQSIIEKLCMNSCFSHLILKIEVRYINT